ncbi:MAG: hypothetical protein HQL97_01225 [Magnetococcales bacterium]|nr:hypothetical protein [Magnetococcales bacterium]
MDPSTMMSLIGGGGPTALIAALAWVVFALRGDLKALQKEFNDFRLKQAEHVATKDDLENINKTMSQIFDLLRKQQDNWQEWLLEQRGFCGRDCAAVRQAPGERRG